MARPPTGFEGALLVLRTYSFRMHTNSSIRRFQGDSQEENRFIWLLASRICALGRREERERVFGQLRSVETRAPLGRPHGVRNPARTSHVSPVSLAPIAFTRTRGTAPPNGLVWCVQDSKSESKPPCQRGNSSRFAPSAPPARVATSPARAAATRATRRSSNGTTAGGSRCTPPPSAARRRTWSGTSSARVRRPRAKATATARLPRHAAAPARVRRDGGPVPRGRLPPSLNGARKRLSRCTSPPRARRWRRSGALAEACPAALLAGDCEGRRPVHVRGIDRPGAAELGETWNSTRSTGEHKRQDPPV
jgi:hypothetical protein